VNRFSILGAIVAVLAILAYNSVFVVNEREQAIVVRFGQIQDVKSEPGIYFKMPLAMLELDNVQIIEDRKLRFDLNDIRVQVSGGKFYEVDAFVVYSVDDARKFRSTVGGDLTQAEARLRTRLDSALRRTYGVRGFESALSKERGAMMTEVRGQLEADAAALGITIDDVRIRRTDLTKEVSEQTYERMKAERFAEAELIRARGNEGAQRIRAVADRQVVELESAAQRESEILRGEGDAERNKVFAEAFSKDPEFFEFYRSMQAYSQALEGAGTSMVLSPNSEFFRYFGNPAGAQKPAAQQ
jgi:membrane protease subunit HflC